MSNKGCTVKIKMAPKYSILLEFIIVVKQHITALTSVCLYQTLLKFREVWLYIGLLLSKMAPNIYKKLEAN